MNNDQEVLGQAIDKLDSLAAALTLPLPADMHVQQLKRALPEIVRELKSEFAAVTGENPWE